MTSRIDRGAAPARANPQLSIVVPAHQASATLGRVLAALEASDLPRHEWELIVVDDASSDDTALIAARHAEAVIRLPDSPRGPAYARNRGVELARAPLVLFLDADVLLRPDTLRRMLAAFERDANLGLLSAVLDPAHSAPGMISRYRNLRRHAEQLRVLQATEALWGGCCMVRRELLATAGHFDEWHFAGPQHEVRELGRRFVQTGARIAVDPEITAVHLKQFTLRSLLMGELWRRRVTHVRLAPQTQRLHLREALLLVAFVLVAAAAVTARHGWALAGAGALAGALVLDGPLLYSMLRRGGVLFTIASLPLHALTLLVQGMAHIGGALLRHAVGAPRPDPTHEAYSEIGLRGWPPPPYRPRPEPRPTVAAGDPQ